MTIEEREWRRTKSALTRASNQVNRVKDHQYVAPSLADLNYARRVAVDAWATFERYGYPDWWARLERLEDDITRWTLRLA